MTTTTQETSQMSATNFHIIASVDASFLSPPPFAEESCKTLAREIEDGIHSSVYHILPDFRGEHSPVPDIAGHPSIRVCVSRVNLESALRTTEVRLAVRDACPTVPGDILDYAVNTAVRAAKTLMGVCDAY